MPAFSFRHIKDLYTVFWDKSTEMTDSITKAIQNDRLAPEVAIFHKSQRKIEFPTQSHSHQIVGSPAIKMEYSSAGDSEFDPGSDSGHPRDLARADTWIQTSENTF